MSLNKEFADTKAPMGAMNFIIIGYGGMGAYHTQLIKKYGTGRVVAAYDIDPERQKAAAETGLKAYGSESEMWADANFFDAAIVAVPNDVHPYYCEKLGLYKKHAICEKPAANSPAEFISMMKAAEKSGTVLEVHQNRRWDADFLTARAVEEKGYIGKLYRVESRVMGANGIPGGWRKQIKHGGGMMLDWGVHLIDQACLWRQGVIYSLYAQYSYMAGFEVEDGFRLTLGFDGGLTYEITVDTNTFTPLPRWMLYGQDGTAQIIDWDMNGAIAVKKESAEKVVGIKAGNGFTKTMAARPASATEYFELPVVRPDGSEFYSNFIAACLKKEPQAVSGESVLRVLRIMEAAKESADSGKVLTGLKL